MSVDQLNKFFEKKKVPKEISDYILGNVPKLNYSSYYYHWDDIAENTIKYLGIDDERALRALKTLYVKDEWDFSETVLKSFENSYEGAKKLIETLREKMGMKLKDISTTVYNRYNRYQRRNKSKNEKNMARNIADVMYNEDKDSLRDMFLALTDTDALSHILPCLYDIDYDYYEGNIKSHLEKHINSYQRVDHFFKYIKDIEFVEELTLKKMREAFANQSYSQDVVDSIISYIETGKEDKNFKESMKKIDKKTRKYEFYRFPNSFLAEDFYNMSDFQKRIFEMSLRVNIYETMRMLFNKEKKTFENTKNLMKVINITLVQLLDYLFQDSYFKDDEFKLFLDDDKEAVLEVLRILPNINQENALHKLFEIDKLVAYDFMLDILPKATTKGLKNEVLTQLNGLELEDRNIKEDFIALLNHKKSNVREISVNMLIERYEDKDEAIFKAFLKKEKSATVTKIVMDFFEKKQISFAVASSGKKGEKPNELPLYSKEWFIFTSKKAKKKNLAWLDLNSLPKLHYKDDGKEIGEKELYHFINIAADEKAVIPVEQFKKFGSLIKDEDLVLMADKMYQIWNREAKTKWALAFVAAFGQDNLIKPLKDEILKFVDYGRGAIAAQMVEAIAMIGTTNAFQTVDWFTKKVRHKQVKNASNEALVTAARELGITKDELLDKIVPDFGFNEEGIVTLDFGPRQFEIKLNLDLSFKITDSSSGKVFKNLPKPGKNDDAEKGGIATKFFKEMKKEVKNQVKIQKNRLENGFSANRFWKINNWTELFVKNPMMKQFALTLIWGIYDGPQPLKGGKEDKNSSFRRSGGLVKGFRFLEDGSFTNIDEDEITIKETENIGLIHPIELSQEELENWKEQLDDYEITQSFEQLNRAIYKVSDENKDKLQLEDFMGFIIYRSSLKNKLFNKGWERGSVQDAGCYYEYYKLIEEYGLEIELNFGGDCMYDDGDVPIKEIVFYRANTVARGSYMYDKPKKENVFSLGQIPERLYSEVYHEIKTIAESGKGFEEGWEKKDWW